MSFFEWLGRVIMLVLAGMITLSIISALAAISSSTSLPQQIGFERRPVPEPRSGRPEELVGADAPEPGRPEPRSEAGGSVQVAAAPAPPEPADPAKWLEAIAYALLALAGLAAFGCLLLWRGIRQQRRIADALEALSAAPRPSYGPPSAASRDG